MTDMGNKKQSKPNLDALRPGGERSTVPTAPTASGPTLCIYAGRTGPDEEFEHIGRRCVFPKDATAPVVFEAGLNIIEHDWSSIKDDDVISGLLEEGEHGPQLKIVTRSQLEGFSRTRLKRLAKMSQQAAGLAILLEIERARPDTGPRKGRRDGELVNALERKLRHAQGKRHPGYGDVVQAAQMRVAV
jgi:hypothetical protein